MSAHPDGSNTPPASRATSASASAPMKKSRCHNPGGTALGQENSREAQRVAAAILEVLAGARTPGQAAQALGVSVPRYYHLESRALRAFLDGCEAKPRGRVRSPERELTALKRQQDRLQRELTRHQTLVRVAQRTIGLAPPPATTKPAPGKKRRRRPVVRALQAAKHLQQENKEAMGEGASPGNGTHSP